MGAGIIVLAYFPFPVCAFFVSLIEPLGVVLFSDIQFFPLHFLSAHLFLPLFTLLLVVNFSALPVDLQEGLLLWLQVPFVLHRETSVHLNHPVVN